jgi:hypothetical protein
MVDLTEEKGLETTAQSETDLLWMQSLGVTKTQDEFFASTTKFINARNGGEEGDKAVFFRHEIWNWMEQSLAKGQYKWIVKVISPMYDIRALYHKICSLANKATWISHALEFKKIFEISPAKMDIFQYHSELTQQIKLIRMQGETLGLEADVPSWMEQSLLLIAAWQNPNYRKIALDFTMEGKTVSVESLLRELQKQQLLTAHLNKSGEKPDKSDRTDVRVRQATSNATEPKYCFGFKRQMHPRKLPLSPRKIPRKQVPRAPAWSPQSQAGPGYAQKVFYQEEV